MRVGVAPGPMTPPTPPKKKKKDEKKRRKKRWLPAFIWDRVLSKYLESINEKSRPGNEDGTRRPFFLLLVTMV